MRPKALVLGEKLNAERIAAQLAEEGFDPILQEELHQKSLPTLIDGARFQKMRNLFAKFKNISAGKGIVHPGTTLWAERPELLTIAYEFNLLTLGPSAKVLSFFRNKFNLLFEAGRIGVPHLLLKCDPMHSVREIQEWVLRSGQSFPFVLKAVKGEGSQGIFIVQDPSSFEKAVPLWLDQLRQSLGEVILFAERFLEGARHVFIPFARFQDGRINIFPISDASLQSRHRKIIEFCPANCIDPPVHKRLIEYVTILARHSHYVGVGAFEFLLEDSEPFLINGMPRLNSGFQLWESVAGTRAVSWQIATSGIWPDAEWPLALPENQWKSGMSLRIYAEDSVFQLPQAGNVRELSDDRTWKFHEYDADGNSNGEPSARGELNLNIKQGESLSIFDSGIVGTLFVTAHTRSNLVKTAQRILEKIWIAGSLHTNERFLMELLKHPWVKEDVFHIDFIDDEFLLPIQPSREVIEMAGRLCSFALTQEKKTDWIIGEQWMVSAAQSELPIPWTRLPQIWTDQSRTGVSGVIYFSDEAELRACVFPLDDSLDRWIVRIGSWFLNVRGMIKQTAEEKRKNLHLSALMAGRVHAVLFREGTTIPAHHPLLMIESFGALVPHALPTSARVTKWKVNAEDIVYSGQKLADLELLR